MPGRVLRVALLALSAWATAATAHDTWFEMRGQRTGADVFLDLGTGNLYPVFEYAIEAGNLQQRGCRLAGQRTDLTPVAGGSTALVLKARLGRLAPASCWAQLLPSELEMPADLVAVYLDEARPPAAVRQAWAAMQARGLPWKERYTKHARIVFAGDGTDSTAPAAMAGSDDMGMDMVLLGNGGTLRAGDPASVEVLRDGRPLPGLAVELRHRAGSAYTSQGIWLQTDAHGRVQLELPTAGKWLLRGIDIRLSETEPGTWESRFATLAFEVAARAAR